MMISVDTIECRVGKRRENERYVGNHLLTWIVIVSEVGR